MSGLGQFRGRIAVLAGVIVVLLASGSWIAISHASAKSTATQTSAHTTHAKAKPKAKHGAHTYSYADLGLDDDHVRATFAPYVAHYGITEE